MSGYGLLVFAPIGGIIFNIFIHLGLSRIKKGKNQWVNLFLGFLSGFIPVFALVFAAQKTFHRPDWDFIAYLAFDLLAYAAISYGYFHFININLASVRIRVLQEISESCGISEKEILNRYNCAEILDKRLARFINSGQLELRQGKYFLGRNKNFLILFWLFEGLKFTFLGRGNRLISAACPVESEFSFTKAFWNVQFFRFLSVGFLNTVFGYLAYVFFVLIKFDYRISLTFSTMLAVLFNYCTNGRLVFRNLGSRVLGKFVILNILLYIFNQALLISLVSLGLGKLISQAVIMPVIIAVSFWINKQWVFKRVKETECPA